MPSLKEFRKNLQQAAGTVEQERLAQIREKELLEKAKEERAEREENRRNKAVLDAESKIPAREYLEELRLLINPSEEMMRFGPSHGAIAYGFVYNETTQSFEQRRGGRDTHYTTVWRKTYNAITVVLTHMKRLTIITTSDTTKLDETCNIDKLNPLLKHEYEPFYWDNRGDYKGDSKREFKLFTQKLTKFYTDQKIP